MMIYCYLQKMLFYRWKKVQMRRWLRQVNSATLIFWRFSKRRTDHIETSQLICKANQLTGFYMIRWFDKRKPKKKGPATMERSKIEQRISGQHHQTIKNKSSRTERRYTRFFKKQPDFSAKALLAKGNP